MKASSIIVLLLLFASLTSFAQGDYGSIHVKVLDAETNQPVPFANVYINQTTIGGFANDQGEVDVTKIPFGTHQLVISEIGHIPQQRKLIIRGKPITYITVKLKERMLDAVTVVAKHDRRWKRQLKRFEKMFFGSAHFKQCNITNPSALQFKDEGGQFIVDSKEPLKIENKYLGYNLDFVITNCFFTAENFNITGYVRFEEKKGDEKESAKWKEHREKIYRGSPQHFFHTVIDSGLQTEGYRVYADITGQNKIIRGSTLSANINKTIVPDTIARRLSRGSDGMYNISFPDRLEVHYLRRPTFSFAYTDVGYAVSWIEVKQGTTIVVSPNGLIQNPEDMTVVGAMSNLRVADWLPLDYQYDDESIEDPIISPKRRIALLEKPYVQTDRQYYYNNETMWFKGYMSYLVPNLKDTLSQTVHVELSDASGKIVASRRYHMEDGRFNGDVVFGKNWQPGFYQLKVYTSWMLNFDRRLIFTKTIDLLAEREAVRIPTSYTLSADTLPNVWLHTDKRSYSAREKITVKIDVMDSLEFPTVSNLSMSVTDVEQAVPHRKEKNIATNYLYEDKDPEPPARLPYDIEYGIPFNGRFILGKKIVQGILSFFQDSTKGSFGIITDNEGQFKKNLLFNDTIHFWVMATDANKRHGQVVMDTSRLRCPPLPLEPLSLDVYLATTTNDARKMNLNGTNILPEFSLKARKIIQRRTPARIVGSGDYVVTGEWINERGFPDVLAAVAAKIPGCVYDPSGPSIRFIAGMFGSLGGGGGPLILIDGLPVNDALQIIAIPMRAIDYVDVSKFASATKFGSRGANGVIEIHTKTWKQKDPNDPSFDKNRLQEITWVGYTTASTFESPDYTKAPDNDYYDSRATIYWSPSLTTNGKDTTSVSFYAADTATRYRIIVEGVTATGEPVHAERIIEVVKGR